MTEDGCPAIEQPPARPGGGVTTGKDHVGHFLSGASTPACPAER